MIVIYSFVFYINLYGYKFCMRINLNGVDSGVGKYVVFFVYMMQGDYDIILEWLFIGRIVLFIMDQFDGVEYCIYISEIFVVKFNFLVF